MTFLPFLGKAYHVDEPLFLAPARHILEDPLHPLSFDFNWYGRKAPMAELNNTPPLMLYLLAGAWRLTGGREGLMRLLFFPFDLGAALALYLLAGRFLERPLGPTLAALASPGCVVGLNLLYPDKLGWAFGVAGLWLLVVGVQDRRSGRYWGSAALLGTAVLAKYGAAAFLFPATAFALDRGVPRRRVLAYGALALSPLGAYLLADWLTGPAAVRAAWTTTWLAARAPWAAPAHRLRSFLAFTGGCAGATAAWPLLLGRRERILTAMGAGGAAVLFLPVWDGEPVLAVDRLTGVLLAAAALAAFMAVVPRRKGGGWVLWTTWIAAVAALQLGVYWSILARLVFFLVPPAVFSLAERLERALPASRRRILYAVTTTTTVAMSLALAVVDYRYAQCQRAFAERVAAPYVAAGRKVWFTGHWGFQYYLERAGALALDAGAGGWGRPRPGDVVVVGRVNVNIVPPPGGRWPEGAARELVVDSRIPLRLISGFRGQGAFFSSAIGFLPFSFAREPIEDFLILEPR